MRALDGAGAAIGSIPDDWLRTLGPAASREGLAPIVEYVAAMRRQTPGVLPDADRVFAALAATPFDSVRAVILGQDPYPTRTHATGLAFSVPRDLPPPLPRSLKNIHGELAFDLELTPPSHGSLEAWARHGVLLGMTTPFGPTTSAADPVSTPPASLSDRLSQLEAARTAGLITDEEFAAKRTMLIDGL